MRGRKKGELYKTHLWKDGHRECVKCKQILPFSMFHKHNGCYMGVNTVCKTCRKPVSKKQWEQTDQRIKMLSRCKNRALLQNREFNITLEDIDIPDVCPVFKVKFDTSNDFTPSVDRIDSTKGYIKGNIMIISNKANRMKSNASYKELKLFAEWINNTVCEI